MSGRFNAFRRGGVLARLLPTAMLTTANKRLG